MQRYQTRKATFHVEDWIVDQKNVIESTEFEAEILAETEKAYQVEVEAGTEWFPKSQIKTVDEQGNPAETPEQQSSKAKEGQEGNQLTKNDLAVKWAVEASSRNLIWVQGIVKTKSKPISKSGTPSINNILPLKICDFISQCCESPITHQKEGCVCYANSVF